MIPRRLRLWPLAAVLLVAASRASAVDFFNPENGHFYRSLIREYSWDDARGVAFSQTHNGLRGHLVTITDSAEQTFIENLAMPRRTIWLGGFQPTGSPEPDGNWQWVTGEPFSYSNWAPEEPNDYSGEHLIEMWAGRVVGGQVWNDISATQYAGRPQINTRPVLVEFTPGYSPKLTGLDFLFWQRSLGRRTHRGDFNGDGVVSASDLQLWQTAGFVPEPAAATLLFIAVGFFQGARRTRWCARGGAALSCRRSTASAGMLPLCQV